VVVLNRIICRGCREVEVEVEVAVWGS
jgi:hypothetical protein